MNQDIITVYTENAQRNRLEQKANARQIGWLSVARLLLFLGFGWFLVAAFRVQFRGAEILYALGFIILFLICVFWAAGLQKKNQFLQQLVLINENELAIINNKRSSFLDNGEAFAPAKGFAVDLGIFGPYSLFHLLNRTGSLSGGRQLSERLHSPFLKPADIENYQSCIKELAAKTGFRQTLLAHTLLLEEEKTLDQLQAGISMGDFSGLRNRFWTILAAVWPVAGVLLTVFSIWTGNFSWLLAFMIIGLLVLATILKKVNLLYFHISKRSYLYGQYAKCFQLIGHEKFEHPYLVQKQTEIVHAAKAFQNLSGLTGVFDLRLSMLSLFINGLFMLDLLCARAYLRWSSQYQGQVKNWFDTLGEIESLNSLASFHYNRPAFVFPQCDTEQLAIKAEGMGHPLMNVSSAVVNDIAIGDPEKLHLITGSNMSGKSTFLRTLGLNMILAQSGAPVFANSFLFRPMRLLTSFHHIDSLEESTSYFYAELKSLQDIIQSLPQPEPALVLLDEVMRGTNSKDKHDGTAMLIQKLLNYSCLALIATHDTELGVLAEQHPGAIANFCFESELSEDGLHFDFTMRKGVAQTKNATYLMKQMGII
jgi:hypothetical protein